MGDIEAMLDQEEETASDNRSEYVSDVKRILEINIYVDEMLKSFESITEAKDVIKKIK